MGVANVYVAKTKKYGSLFCFDLVVFAMFPLKSEPNQKKWHLGTGIPEPSSARLNMTEKIADVTFSDGLGVKVYKTMVCVR